MLKSNTVYLCVKDLDRAIKFWEAVLGKKVKNRYKTRWADFGEKEFNFGLYNPAFDGQTYKKGDNVIVNFYTNNVKKEHARIKKLKPKQITEIQRVNFMFPYDYFMFIDLDGNLIEVAEWKKK